jgi:NAD(P)-dependent dehydrogenase (short-subunit alcohol dehydrogenase family)
MFQGKHAVVTGAAQGIGARTATRLGEQGALVAAWDLNGAGAEATAEAIVSSGGNSIGVSCDVADHEQVLAALERSIEQFGPPTLVVTAAGIIRIARFLDVGPDDFKKELMVNLAGTFHVLQASTRAMVSAGLQGSAVCVASVAGRGPRPDAAAYAASKAGVISLVRSAAVALAGYGINVNAVCPGVVDTEMTRRIARDRARLKGISQEEALEQLVRTIPLGRLQQTDDVVDVISFLLSPSASYVTGQALNACGGLEFD